MTNKHHFKFDVDINVINHLGVGLYSSTPAALTELVANAWDADAEEVLITIDPVNHSIIIEDDGHGMTASDVAKKFLHVGYSRRTQGPNPNFSNSGKRRVMGRKGIGKLSMFALADMVKVSTQTAGGELIGFEVDVPTLRDNLANCLVPCDHIPRRSWPLFRAKAILNELLADLSRSSSPLNWQPE